MAENKLKQIVEQLKYKILILIAAVLSLFVLTQIAGVLGINLTTYFNIIKGLR